MAMKPDEELHQSLAKLLISSDYSDLTVKCGSDVHKVHKAIVCPRAEFFAAADRFGGKEAASGEVVLEEDDPELVKCMFQYLYTLDYSSDSSDKLPEDTATKSATSMSWPSAHAESSAESAVRELQIQLGVDDSPSEMPRSLHISRLKGRCPDEDGKFRDGNGNIIAELTMGNPSVLIYGNHTFDAFGCTYSKRGGIVGRARMLPVVLHPPGKAPSNLVRHASMYSIADKFGIPGLKALAKKKFRVGCDASWDTAEFPMALDVVYTTTVDEDKGLRNIILKTISDHMELLKKPEIEAAMLEFSGLAFGLLKMKHL